jgi:hypothetical protein
MLSYGKIDAENCGELKDGVVDIRIGNMVDNVISNLIHHTLRGIFTSRCGFHPELENLIKTDLIKNASST